jgi:branched-chain amino acid transport system ATP-binding protein
LTLAGLLPRVGGAIRLDSQPLPHNGVAANKRGVVLVPDDRSLFRTLTAIENLRLATRSGSDVDWVIELFPELSRRMNVVAGMLSGGEQQMLAIGRALAQRPRVLLIDELSMGLAPLIVDRILQVLREVADSRRVAIVLVEQHVKGALKVADRAVVVVHGRTVLQARADELLADLRPLEEAYLGFTA